MYQNFSITVYDTCNDIKTNIYVYVHGHNIEVNSVHRYVYIYIITWHCMLLLLCYNKCILL